MNRSNHVLASYLSAVAQGCAHARVTHGFGFLFSHEGSKV